MHEHGFESHLHEYDPILAFSDGLPARSADRQLHQGDPVFRKRGPRFRKHAGEIGVLRRALGGREERIGLVLQRILDFELGLG